jgi:amino acid transporter
MISALGAVNGLIFTGARVYSTIGKDYAILSWMSGWNRKHGAPVPALICQGVLVLALVFLFGTTQGRDGINWLLDRTATRMETVAVKDDKGKETGETKEVQAGHVLKPMEWDKPGRLYNPNVPENEKASLLAKGGFETLLACTAPVFWGFFLLTGLSVFVLRELDRGVERPFKVPFYPLLPLIFCCSCGYMLYSSIDYAALDRKWKGGLVLLGAVPLVLGMVLYGISQAIRPAPTERADARQT